MPTTNLPLKLDLTEFNAVFEEYLKVNRRTLALALNTKAYYIALRAVAETPKADKLKIGQALSPLVYDFSGKHGKFRTAMRFGRYGQEYLVPVVALMINKQRKQQGKPGLYGARMKKAVKHFISNRQRTVSFLKSGWLPAIKTLAPLADKKNAPPMGESPVRYGKAKGRAVPATPGTQVTAIIANSIGATGKQAAKHSAALKKYGGPALQRAVNAEAASMVKYLEDKAYDAAQKLGIKARR